MAEKKSGRHCFASISTQMRVWQIFVANFLSTCQSSPREALIAAAPVSVTAHITKDLCGLLLGLVWPSDAHAQ